MSYEYHPAIIDALKNALDYAEREGGDPLPGSIAREIVLTSRGDLKKAPYRIAALSLLLGGLELSAGNVAWLIRDRVIGFPDEPTFQFGQD